MTANYLVCNIEGTNKREKNKKKACFSFLFRAKVLSTWSKSLWRVFVINCNLKRIIILKMVAE